VRGRTLRVRLSWTRRETVTVTVLSMKPALVTSPVSRADIVYACV
jgi:hypothetical protein